MKLLVDVIGWIAAVLIVVAYGLNSYQKIKSDSLTFQLLNLVGGVFFIIYGVYYGVHATVFINAVWTIIAIIAIFQLLRRSKSPTS